MREKLAVIGAGGHGRVCAEIAELCGYREIVFLDDAPGRGARVLGPTALMGEIAGEYDLFVAIGDNGLRRRFIEEADRLHGALATLVHPGSIVSRRALVECGSMVAAGAVINPGARIGRGVIVNTCSSVDHDCVVEAYSHISVGAHLAGTVYVGQGVCICAGATVGNNLCIAAGCVIGTGAAVVKDILVPGRYCGVPARMMK